MLQYFMRDILSDSEAEELDIEDGETDNFGDDERDSLGHPSPRRVTTGSVASLNRDHSSGTLFQYGARLKVITELRDTRFPNLWGRRVHATRSFFCSL